MDEKIIDKAVQEKESNEFRDHLATLNESGKRKWIFPKKPKGRFYNARTVVSIILLAILFLTPFIKVNGHPFMLFDVINRNFILFGIPFGPHDFHIFVIAMIAFIVFIFLFTVVFGRVFCGWACPQTIFLEMVFRKIEYWIEGDYRNQKKLKAAPWTSEKIFKKTFKHAIFFALSFIISNTFLAYIIGIDKLQKIVTDPPAQHIEGLISITIFSGIFYFVFSSFREQACTMVCPYGRLQGVLLDRDSVVIAYDHVRGEPRGKLKRGENNSSKGDCIDCHLCVDVCPTGIDIRNGIQLECVNCTACIDACDEVMDKINRPRGLIKFASINSIEKNTKFKFTPRAIGYSVVLSILVGVLAYMLITRTDYSINIFRTPGLIYQERPGNKVSNIYDLNIVNKTFDPVNFNLKLENIDGELKVIGNQPAVQPQEIIESKFMIILDKDKVTKMSTPVTVGVYKENELIRTFSTSFLAPLNKEKKK